MKYNVKIGDKTFSVEIEDINARPVVARVDGQVFEVMPESGETVARRAPVAAPPAAAPNPMAASPAPVAGDAKCITAPLPGTVVEVFVKPGETVQAGHVLLIIEAMKMKNSIRATRGGTLAAVLVSTGQTVAHKQALVEFDA